MFARVMHGHMRGGITPEDALAFFTAINCILPSADIAFISHLFFLLIIFFSYPALLPEGTSTLTIRK